MEPFFNQKGYQKARRKQAATYTFRMAMGREAVGRSPAYDNHSAIQDGGKKKDSEKYIFVC